MPSKKARRVAGLLDVTLDAVLVRSASRQPKTEEAQAEQRERAGFGDHERIGKCDASASVGQLIEEGDLSGIVEGPRRASRCPLRSSRRADRLD